jgi:hypothetical protein
MCSRTKAAFSSRSPSIKRSIPRKRTHSIYIHINTHTHTHTHTHTQVAAQHTHDLQRTEATEAKITAASAAADAKIAGKRDLLYSKETYYI